MTITGEEERNAIVAWIRNDLALNHAANEFVLNCLADGIERGDHRRTVCEPVAVSEDGWSEWIHPLPGYLMQCCDCGLVHKMDFEIVPRDESNATLNPGERDDAVIIFRARRA